MEGESLTLDWLSDWLSAPLFSFLFVLSTFLNFRMEAYSAAVGSWMARELTEDRGDLLTPLAPLPLAAIGPLMAPFPLPFPLPPFPFPL